MDFTFSNYQNDKFNNKINKINKNRNNNLIIYDGNKNKELKYINYFDILNLNTHKLPLNKLNVYMITPNQGGGTTKYVMDIINRYKDVNFNICITKNKLYSFQFKKNDIIWIHHLFLSDITIEDIILLKQKFNIRIIITIHDWYFLSNTLYRTFDCITHNVGDVEPWHNMYLYINSLNQQIQINKSIIDLFSNSDLIIHPTKFTYDIYSKFFSNNKFVIYDHIDINITESIKKDRVYIPNIHNNVINISNLSSFSNYKGKQQITYLLNNVTNYKGYKINYYIVGLTIEPYDELEFFDIIKKYNIHGLLHLNRVGETWCYSLTKSIYSNLPIFYNNYGAIKERINHKKHVSNIENELEYCDYTSLKTNYYKFLDKIIINSSSGHNLNNKTPTNVSHSMYDFILNKNINFDQINLLENNLNIDNICINCENLVVITSKIIVSNTKLSYINERSIYTEQERFQQIVETIASVKKYIPNSFIILIDNSKLNNKDIDTLNNLVNLFIHNTTHYQLNYFTDKCIYKGCGELAQILYVINNYILKIKNISFNNFIKISGRYKIIDNIEYLLSIDDNVFKKNTMVTDKIYFYTCFYKIVEQKFIDYYKALLRTYSNTSEHYKDLEVNLPNNLNYDFYEIDTLNIQQNIGVWVDKSII